MERIEPLYAMPSSGNLLRDVVQGEDCNAEPDSGRDAKSFLLVYSSRRAYSATTSPRKEDGTNGAGGGGIELSSNNQSVIRNNSLISIFSIFVYLFTWVANGELTQGVVEGSLAPLPFPRAAFISWSAFNMMLLSWIPFVLCCRYSSRSPVDFLHHTWAGSFGFKYMLCWSCALQFLQTALNVFWIVGLTNLSVATSNAIYQLQATITILLSVWFLGASFIAAEAVGIVVSILGVAMIVVPPMLNQEDDDLSSPQSAVAQQYPMLGIIATFLSAVVWSFYQVAWRIVSKGKEKLSRFDGLLDTLATLGVMGFVNLFICWPVLLVLHWTGVEAFAWPSSSLLPILTLNGLVEYSSDASCAVAIYLTSPIITAITGPLTIPISFVWDHILYGTPLYLNRYDWIGSLLVLTGVACMKLKIFLLHHEKIQLGQFRATTETQTLYCEFPESSPILIS